MNLLMFRGGCPQDRPIKEIAFNSIKESDCIYEHLAYQLGNKFAEIVYWNGNGREKWYSDKCVVRWTKDIKKHKPLKKPDVIFNRGGFEEPLVYIRNNANIFCVRYGAGKRFLPEKGIPYDLTLQDSPEQLEKAMRRFPDIRHELWIKPSTYHFRPMPEIKKEYDICFIANGGQAKIKGVKFVYKTAPKHLKILHLGFKSKYKPPENITRKRVLRKDMPEWINKCRVCIAPYGKTDSAPRAVIEAMACGLPVVAFHGLKLNVPSCFIWKAENTKNFWSKAEYASPHPGNYTFHKEYSIEKCVKHLRSLIYADKEM